MAQTATKNWGRIVLIVAAAIALVSLAYALMRGKPDASPMAGMPTATSATGPAARIEALEKRVAADPKDGEGWQLLGATYFEMQRHADAARAYRRALDVQPRNATLWSSLGEVLVMADEHDPMPAEALAAFRKAVALDAKEPRARYFWAVKRDLDGDHKGAIDDWFALLNDTPPGAPWEADLKRTISQVGKINKIEVEKRLADYEPPLPHPALRSADSVAAEGIPGPTPEQMAAAASLAPGQQQSMVEGMVARLEGKLAANPANVDGWIMLMRSRMTLGQTTQASAALKKAVAANPGQASRIRSEARILNVPGA